MDDKLYLIMPAYNEEENIMTTVAAWYPVVEKYGHNSRMVVIDDGSTDATYEKLQELAKDKPGLVVLTKENGGHGDTLLMGYRYAIKQHADYIFQTDSDGQTNPEEFAEFWNKRQEKDMVIGYRNHREDGLARIVVTKVLKIVLRCIFGVQVTDANAPFRLMKTETVGKYMHVMPKHYNLPNVILSVVAVRQENVIFLPITFRARQAGVNSINIKKIFGIGIRALRDFRRIKANINNRLPDRC